MAYRADIEIAVRGAQELKRLQDQVSATSKLVDGLNNYLSNIGGGGVVRSINNLNAAVADTAAAFNKAALGTEEATLAARNFVSANSNLTRGLEERLALLKSIEEQERRQRLGAAGIRETTQYAGPIGPGEASPVNALVGQRSPVEERIRRTIDARQDELRLEQALLQLEEKSAAVANKELQARGEIARLAAQGVNAAAFRAAQTGTQVALPAFQERGLKLLDDSVRANESNRRIEQALNGERQRGVRFLEKQTAEEQRQVQLGLLGEKTRNLAGTRGRTPAAPAGGFPVAGPLQSPGFQRTKGQVGKFGENLALGAGFPLLFGGGAGSVAGSALGSFVGPGFGGQILGGAIGQILDQAVQKAAQLGSALQLLDISKIEESGVRINANLETQISLIRQTGNAYAAQQAIQQEIFATTGALPGTVQGISDSVNVLSSAWSEFTAATSVTLGIIAAPFAAALGAAIRLVNLLLKGFNVVASGLGGLIQKTGEWVVELVAGGEALKNIQDFFSSLNPAIDEARAKYAAILGDLNGQVLLNREILELEKQKTTGNTAGGKDRNLDLTAQQKILSINAEIDNEIREINKDITEATKSQVDEAVRLLNVKRNQKIEEVQIETSIQRQRTAEEAREKAAREAARAAEEAARAVAARANALRQIEKEFYTDQLKILDINVQQVEILEGEEAALQRQAALNEANARIRGTILSIEREIALQEAAKTGTVSQVARLYEQRRKILQDELDIQNETTRARAAQIQLDKFVGAQQAVQTAVKPFEDLRFKQEQETQAAKTYSRLLQEGILPAEAERRANFDKLVSAQLRSLDIEIAIQKSIIQQAISYGVTIQKVLELQEALKNMEAARAAVTGAAATGPGAGPTDRERLQTEADRVRGELNTLTDPINAITTAAAGIGDAFGTSFKGIISGSMTAKEALANFFTSVADMFLDMAAQIITKMITMAILNAVLGVLPGSSGALPGAAPQMTPGAIVTPTGFSGQFAGLAANGATFANGIATFARGGVVGSPTMFKFAQGGAMQTGLMGEAGPEAIMPLTRGPGGQLGVSNFGGGGSAVNVVVNVDAKGSSVEGNDQGANQLGRVISAAVQSELIKQQRPGGILAR